MFLNLCAFLHFVVHLVQRFQHEHRSRLPRDDRACSLLRIHDLRRPQLQPEPDVTQTNWTAAYGPKFKCVVYTHGLTGEQVPAALQKALVEAGCVSTAHELSWGWRYDFSSLST